MEEFSMLKGYLNKDGKFDRMPGKKQKKKVAAMLQFLALQFDSEKKYSESEVNEILNQYHSFNEPATLRRLMFGSRLLDRTIDGRNYWVTAKKTD